MVVSRQLRHLRRRFVVDKPRFYVDKLAVLPVVELGLRLGHDDAAGPTAKPQPGPAATRSDPSLRRSLG